MNMDLKQAFARIKPVCDLVMVSPTPEKIATFTSKVAGMKLEAVQELQQYILFPFITHIKSEEMDKKYELQSKMADAMKQVLERVSVTSFEMCMKIETALLSLVFDKSKPGMVAEVPEELKLSVMQCLTTLMLHLDQSARTCLLKTQVPTVAQAVFVAVHIAKLEKLRSLRLAAIDCLTVHTCTHRKLTDNRGRISDNSLELLVVDTLSNILPGVLAALQDVATDVDNPGHAVVVAALEATHRILCLTMHGSLVPRAPPPTARDFARLVEQKHEDREVSKDKKQKFLPKRSLEWYAMAGDKIAVVTRSLAPLASHPHPAVRRELALLCYRILDECNASMQPSLPIALDVLISLSKDEYPDVAQYCSNAVSTYMNGKNIERHKTIDGLCENFFNILNSLPRVLNNIDSSRKLSTLNLLHGYVCIMCDDSRPQRLTRALSQQAHMQCCCNALLEAAAIEPLTSLAQHSTRDVLAAPPAGCPWVRLRHLERAGGGEGALRGVLRLLGGAECAELVADKLIELFQQERTSEVVYILNCMAAADNSPLNLVRRVLNTYIEEDVWYLPLEVGDCETPVTSDETLDVSVYDPRAWTKDSVPGLYEGATETRYTGVTYLAPRAAPPRAPGAATAAAAHRNMLLSCLLTEGVGVMAARLKQEYQPFLLKTLCLILERVGSKYEMLHLAGLKAINDIALACGHKNVAELIRVNADYFTNQVTVRLKKAWNNQSALQILSVVMEYSDASILDCLYGIVEDVLVQSCDKYYEKNLDCYLQVFLTFIQCIRKWFPTENKDKQTSSSNKTDDIFKDVLEFIETEEESERLMNCDEFEQESGKSVEEMYREDMKQKEEEILDYDDRVTHEKPPVPQHIRVTETIMKRCINFVSSTRRDQCLLALQVLGAGLPVLSAHEDQLLPLVHQAWGPLVDVFESQRPEVLTQALDLLVTMADLSKDFIRNRTLKEVLPHMYTYLQRSAASSRLRDAGCAYRAGPAYRLQRAALAALPALLTRLALRGPDLAPAMRCASLYLSNKQPKPLQTLAVQCFQALLAHDRGAAWLHLRALCGNRAALAPPRAALALRALAGTPYHSTDKEIEHNIELIWKLV